MPRLRQLPREEAHDDARTVYSMLFGERDPVASPGTPPNPERNPMTSRTLVSLGLCLALLSSNGCMTAFAAFQPENVGGETIVITTTDSEGDSHERVVTPIDFEGRLFVAANHWPRAWYHRALEHPEVRVTRGGETADYRAVAVSDEQRERLLDAPGFPLLGYVFTGFAPRQFLLLDPR